MPEAEDATRRTRLASERTELAWWRTGLTALAVALAVGRVIPELDDSLVEWPYVALGSAFAIYGVVLFWYGSAHARRVERAVSEGGFAERSAAASTGLALVGGFLSLATAVLIVAT